MELIINGKEHADIKLSEILTAQSLVFEDAQNVAKAFEAEDSLAYNAPVAVNKGNVLGENQELLAGETLYVAIQVDMAETVGNEANHNGTNVPSIEFGINVVAN